MVKLFSLLFNLRPNGPHSIKRTSALSIKYEKQRINSFEEDIVQNIRGFISCGIPQMYIAFKMLFLRSLLIGLDILDFLYDGISFLTRYLVHWRHLMLVRVYE